MIYVLATALLLTTLRYATNARRHGFRATLRDLLAALASGVVAGIMLGVSARIAMRLLAIGTGTPLRLTSEGTFTIIVVFSGLGIILGLPYLGMLRGVIGRRPLTYAMILILLTIQPFNRTGAQDLGLGIWDVKVIFGTVLVTVVMWVPYVMMLEVSYRWLSQHIGSRKLTAA